MIIDEGDLLLTCNATGNPTPSISWIKDGSSISTGDDPRIIFGARNETLTITNVNGADRGQYRCVASNNLGNATSNPALLDVQCKYNVREFAFHWTAKFLPIGCITETSKHGLSCQIQVGYLS